MAVNSPRNQPETTLIDTRPPCNWLIVAICLASNAGCHGPGSTAAITFSRSVAAISAWEMVTDSCWNSAP